MQKCIWPELLYLSTYFRNFCDSATSAQLCQENVSSTLEHLENISEKPLSDTMKQTLEYFT